MTLPASPRRATWLIGLVAAVIVAGCGGTAAGGGDGGGGGPGDGAFDAVIPKIQSDFGTSMVGSSVDGNTLTITLVSGASAGMARLFMCANIEPHLKAAGLADSKVIIVDQTGAQLATEAVCTP